MGMNSFTWKMDWQQAVSSSSSKSKSKSKSRSRSDHTSTEYTRTLTKLEGLIADQDHPREYAAQPIDLSALKKEYADPGLGRRVAPRFPLQLSVIAYASNQSFRTESVNVSASGALLKDALPVSFMKGTFEIMFVFRVPGSQDVTKLMFKAKAVGVGSKSPRVAFESSAPNALSSLQSLFSGLVPLT